VVAAGCSLLNALLSLQLVEITTSKIHDWRTPWQYGFSVITNPSLLSRPGLVLPYLCCNASCKQVSAPT
jgi:hypothetical protein